MKDDILQGLDDTILILLNCDCNINYDDVCFIRRDLERIKTLYENKLSLEEALLE